MIPQEALNIVKIAFYLPIKSVAASGNVVLYQCNRVGDDYYKKLDDKNNSSR